MEAIEVHPSELRFVVIRTDSYAYYQSNGTWGRQGNGYALRPHQR